MELGAGELHVWSVRLAGSDETASAFEKLLCAPEIDRLRRFHFEIHRRRFALSRGVLRILLARYLGNSPEQIGFRYGTAGKPSLDAADAALEFNLAHSEDLAIYGFARGCELGVDVEQVRPMPDMRTVAEHFFSPEECADWANAADRVQAFFRCWTRKEAYIKAIGAGLLMPLKSFRVSLAEGEPAALLYTERQSPRNWQMHHLTPDTGYVGAVAYAGEPRSIREWPLIEAGDFWRSENRVR